MLGLDVSSHLLTRWSRYSTAIPTVPLSRVLGSPGTRRNFISTLLLFIELTRGLHIRVTVGAQ